jgi:hypothetical protein
MVVRNDDERQAFARLLRDVFHDLRNCVEIRIVRTAIDQDVRALFARWNREQETIPESDAVHPDPDVVCSRRGRLHAAAHQKLRCMAAKLSTGRRSNLESLVVKPRAVRDGPASRMAARRAGSRRPLLMA